LRLALIGYGSVGKAFYRLLAQKHSVYPFRIVAIHTARHGTAYDNRGLPAEPTFGDPANSIDEFLDRARPDVGIEITTLNPDSGEPAISHIRSAFARGIHVITANKGPIAFAYWQLAAEARAAQVEFRFESTVMDGSPVFNKVRNNLPGIEILGFSGALNSTSKVVLAAMERGLSQSDGIAEARRLGVTEADVSYDLDGWDSAAKGAALANVLMDARTTPREVKREGIGTFSTEDVLRLANQGRTVVLVSRGERDGEKVRLDVRPEVLEPHDILWAAQGTSNVLLLRTDLMGTLATISVNPGVQQTAYGLFVDLVDIARSI
jgi:homoserine dehydrogenase